MAVIGDQPLWFRRDGNVNWVEYDEASDYYNYNTTRAHYDGEFIENLLTYCHVTLVGTHYIRAYVGTADGDVGIDYDYNSDPDVASSLQNIQKYMDFLGILDQIGYDLDSDVVQDAVTRLQTFVNNARAAEEGND